MRVTEPVEKKRVGTGPDALGIAAVPLEEHAVPRTTVPAGSDPPARPGWHVQNDAPLVVPHERPGESRLDHPPLAVDGTPHHGVAGFPPHAFRLTGARAG
jgi:hypothetical protein